MDIKIGGKILDTVAEGVKENTKEVFKEYVYTGLEAVLEVFVEMIGAISLVGCGLLIILKVVGYDNGNKYAGILFTINLLVKYMIGGG